MNKWQDIFEIQRKRLPATPNSPYMIDYYFIVDKRTNSAHAKKYITYQLATTMAERKFNKIIKEVEKLLITTE